MALNFTDYSQVPGVPQAYRFRQQDGSERLFYGPEAERHREYIDRNRAANAYALGPTGGGPAVATDAATGIPIDEQGEPAGDVSTGIAPTEAGPPEPPPQRLEDLPISYEPPPPVPPPPPQTPEAQVAGAVRERVMAPVITRGSPGVSQAQLRARAATGTPTPISATEEREGGHTVDPEYLARDADIRSRQTNLAQEQATRQATELERAGLHSRLEADALEPDIERLRNAEAEVAQGIERDRAVYAKLQKDLGESKIDPGRLFRGGRGTVNTILGAIGQAMGAYAAGMTGSPNFAKENVDAMIARDISAQEQEIRVKGEAADNFMADLMRREDLTLPQARLATAALQKQYANADLLSKAALTKRQDIIAAAEKKVLDDQKEHNDFLEQYRQGAEGKYTQRVTQKVEYPRAGTAGGARAPTLAEQEARLRIERGIVGTVGDVQGLEGGPAPAREKAAAETDESRARAEKARRDAKQGPKQNAQQLAYETSLDTTLDSLDAVVRKFGGKLDRSTGEITGLDIPQAVPLTGVPANPNRVKDLTELKSALTALGITYSNAVNVGAELGEAAKAKLTPTGDATEHTTGKLTAIAQDVIERKRTVAKLRAKHTGEPVPEEVPAETDDDLGIKAQ